MKNRIILLAGILTIGCVSNSHALVTILRDASNLSRGTMPDARHSPSSVTLQGNAIRLTDLAYSTSILTGNVTSYAPAFATAQSTAAFNASTTSLASGSGFRASIIVSTHLADGSVTVQKLSGGGTAYASFDATSASTASLAISTAHIYAGGATAYLDVSGATQTKSGNLSIQGIFTAGSPGNSASNIKGFGADSTLISGGGSFATGTRASMLGGEACLAQGLDSFIGGGLQSQAQGDYSFVAGGRNNTQTGQDGFAAGRAASGTAGGTFVWADSEGVPIQNGKTDQVIFKARGGFYISTNTIYGLPAFYVDSNGNVVQGTITATSKLDIFNGSVSVRGTNAGLNITGGIVRSTGLMVTGLTGCDTVDTDASGNLVCGTDATGGGGSASTNTYASITIGVTSDQGVDVVGNDESAFWTALRRINYAGEIRVRKGNYIIGGGGLPNGVTVPATVEIIFESSANVHNNGSNTIFTSSGIIRNLQLNLNGMYGKAAIKLRNNARLYNTVNDNIRFGQNGVTSGIYDIDGSSNVIIDGMINRVFISTHNGGATTDRPSRYFIRNSSDVLFNNIVDELEYTSSLGGSISDSQFLFVGELNGITIQNAKFKTMGNFFHAQNLTKLAGLSMFNVETEINATNGLNDYFGFSAAGLFQNVSFDGMKIIGSTRAGTGDNGTPISRGFEFATLTSSSTRLNNITMFNKNNPNAPIFTNFLFQSGSAITGTLLTNCNIRAVTTLISNNSSSTSRIGHNVLLNGTFQNNVGGIADP